MISNRMRSRALAMALLAGVAGLRRVALAQTGPTPEASAQASPAAGAGPERVDGRYRLPDDSAVTVIALSFGNPTLPPEYQYGYEVTIDASGHALATIEPVGSRASPPTVQPAELTADLSEDGLQELLAELDALGFFALPPEDPERILMGGEVDLIEVTLPGGQWRVSDWSLETSEQRERFAAAHAPILRAAGLEEPPDLGQ